MHTLLPPLLWVCGETERFGGGHVYGRVKLHTSEQPGSRESARKSLGTKYDLKRYAPGTHLFQLGLAPECSLPPNRLSHCVPISLLTH